LTSIQKARPATLKAFYYRHGSRSQDLIQQRLECVQHGVGVTDEPAFNQTLALRVQLLCRQLQNVQRTLQDFDEQIAKTFKDHPDRSLFASFPGAGPVLAPRLLTALGADRDRFDRAANLQCRSGIAPVTKQSGKSRRIHRRYLCPNFERQSFHEYAKESIRWSRWAAAFYLQQRTKGSPHHTAVRALAFKWQRVIWRCWKSNTPYDEATYEAALRKRGSKIVNFFERIDLGKNPVKNPARKSENPPTKKE
jgi:transposase